MFPCKGRCKWWKSMRVFCHTGTHIQILRTCSSSWRKCVENWILKGSKGSKNTSIILSIMDRIWEKGNLELWMFILSECFYFNIVFQGFSFWYQPNRLINCWWLQKYTQRSSSFRAVVVLLSFTMILFLKYSV